MGGIYSRTYFPHGYQDWISATDLENDDDESTMTEETYNAYITDLESRKGIEAIAQNYKETAQYISNDRQKYLEEIHKEKIEISDERLIYDPLVSNIICDFWLELINQPRETIKQYFKEKRPCIEDLFRDVEKKYNLADFATAGQMIATYKQYT